MEIDPAALSRTNTNGRASATPSLPSKPLPAATSSSAKASKAAQPVPRVDLEPLYTSLKTTIGDNWGTYKDAISQFVLGYLNFEELGRAVDSFISVDINREHIHNQLICGIYANILRDTPDSGVAGWVSANDKPTSVAKPMTGDAAEQRLKSEVMRLPPRLRQRLKGIHDEPPQPILRDLVGNANAKSLHPTGSQHAGGSSASTAAAGLSKDLEIRKRYTLPLISETHDIPPSSALGDRLLPICYEEGLPSGLEDQDLCADLIHTALETFIKEVITDVMSRTRCDAPVSGPSLSGIAASISASSGELGVGFGLERSTMGILTSKYKQRLAEEEAACARGQLKRTEEGLLPVEVQQAAKLGPEKQAPGDLRIAWEIGDQWLKAMGPWQGEKILLDGDYRVAKADNAEEDGDRKLTNGATQGMNGVNSHYEDQMIVDETDWGWHGAAPTERLLLASLLDDCLNVEQ